MSGDLVPRWVRVLLTAGLVVLPIFLAVIWGVAALLRAMEDASGAVAVRYVGLAGGILWVVDLICLVLLQGLESLGERDEPPKQ